MRSLYTPAFRRINVVRSPKDPRDYRLLLLKSNPRFLSAINHKTKLNFVYDQGQIGSCTANATGSMYSWVVNNQSRQIFIPSRLFLYYNTRQLQGTTYSDSGATLRNTMQALRNNGVCAEPNWRYLYENLFERPTPNCYEEGATRQALSYAAVSISIVPMKNVLQTRPFVLGILVYSSFFNPSVAKTGIVPVPDIRREQLLGGHAILVIGYDDRRKAFYCRNSWGTSWGIKGDFYLPYEYATNRRLAFDAWVLYTAENPLANARVVRRA